MAAREPRAFQLEEHTMGWLMLFFFIIGCIPERRHRLTAEEVRQIHLRTRALLTRFQAEATRDIAAPVDDADSTR